MTASNGRPGDPRTIEQIRRHFEVERELADRLRRSTREERTRLFRTMYGELFERVPDHPRLVRREDPAATSRAVASQFALLREFLPGARTFLEIAPGDCRLSFEVAKHVERVIGADISDQSGNAPGRPANFELLVYDGYTLDLPDDSVDVVFSYQFIEHLHPDDVPLHFALVRRVLKPGGVYVFATPHRFSGPHDISGYFCATPQGFHLKEWTYGELGQEVERAGFGEWFTFRFGKARQSRLWNALTLAMERITGWLPARARKAVSRRLFQGVTMLARKGKAAVVENVSVGRSAGAMDERKQSEKDYHDRVFADHSRRVVDKYYSIAGESRRIYRTYLEDNARGATALEYGCGPESYAFVLARKGARVTGIDISEVAIHEVRKLAEREPAGKHTEFHVMDAEHLGFNDSQFDLICGTGILHHLNLDRAYAELARTMKPDGSAIFVEPLGHNPLIRLYRALTPRLRTKDEHPLMIEDVHLARRYFGKVKLTYLHLFCLLAVPFRGLPGFPKLLSFLETFDRTLFRAVPFLGRYAWMVVMVVSAPRKAGEPKSAVFHSQQMHGVN